MQYVTIAYGIERDWKRPFECWLDQFDRIIGEPLVIMTRGEEWIQKAAETREIYPVSIADTDYRRNLNVSGILLAEAARELAPCLVVTLDCEILQKPEEDDWMESAIALGGNHFIRDNTRFIGSYRFEEHNCAVQWCGKPQIGDSFNRHWRENLNDPRAVSIPYWEQVIWSRVWAEYEEAGDATLYPQEMNWSAGVPTEGKDIVFRHYHGSRKNILWDKWKIRR